MASIRQKDNRYCVQIRKKGISLCSSFPDLETAELWAKYKEDLIDEMETFDPPLKEIVTLDQAIQLKIKVMTDENMDKRSIADVEYIQSWFPEFIDKPVSMLTYESLMAKALEMLNGTVFRGGNIKSGKGKEVKTSISTVERKFKVLSTVLSNLIVNGIPIDNNALKVGQYLHKNKI